MPKNIYFHSSIYHLLIHLKALPGETDIVVMTESWHEFIDSLEFIEKAKKEMTVLWDFRSKQGNVELNFKGVRYYHQNKKTASADVIENNNKIFVENAEKLLNAYKEVIG